MRIVSLLPSATEIVCELGLGKSLVGVSHECDYPVFVQDLPRVTSSKILSDLSSCEIDSAVREGLSIEKSLYTLDSVTLARLRPDVLVTQTLCNVCAVAGSEVTRAIDNLDPKPTVINLEPTCLDEVFGCFDTVANALDRPQLAINARSRLGARVEVVAERSGGIANRPRVVLLEWIDPPFLAGHWSPELVRLAGGHEMLGMPGQPSRSIAWEEVATCDPEVLVIACCGFGIERTRRDLPILAGYPGFQDLSCVRSGRTYLTDGNAYFNRPGPRLVDSLEVLAHAIHPNVHPLPPYLNPAISLSSQDFS